MHIRRLPATLALSLLALFANAQTPVVSVPSVDLERYSGRHHGRVPGHSAGRGARAQPLPHAVRFR